MPDLTLAEAVKIANDAREADRIALAQYAVAQYQQELREKLGKPLAFLLDDDAFESTTKRGG